MGDMGDAPGVQPLLLAGGFGIARSGDTNRGTWHPETWGFQPRTSGSTVGNPRVRRSWCPFGMK